MLSVIRKADQQSITKIKAVRTFPSNKGVNLAGYQIIL